MILSLFVFGVFPALLLAAAAYDLGTYTIPNELPAAAAVFFFAFLAFAWTAGEPISWRIVAWHLAAGAVGLGAGAGLFALKWIGGGDAKIYAAACLWLGPAAIADYTVMASLFGGALTIALLLLRSRPVPSFLAQGWVLRLADPQAGVPYGVALALGAIAVLPHTDLIAAIWR